MSILQLRKDLAVIRESLKPDDPNNNDFIYDVRTGIPEEILNGDVVRIFIPDNGREN